MAVLFRRQERVAAQAIERGDESPAPVDAPLPFREQVLAYARLRAAERAAGLTVGETDEETGVNTEALLAALQQQATAAVNAAGATGAATAAAWPLGDEVLEVKTVACPNGTGEVRAITCFVTLTSYYPPRAYSYSPILLSLPLTRYPGVLLT
jgi:hypothetical protein